MDIACSFFTIKDFFYAFLSAGMGTVLGVVWSTWVLNNKVKKQSQNNKTFLKNIVQSNINLLGIALSLINDERKLPNFPLDSATFAKRIDSNIDNYSKDTIVLLAQARYQLDHLNNKIAFANSTAAPTTTGIAVAPHSLVDISQHAQNIRKSLEDVLKLL